MTIMTPIEMLVAHNDCCNHCNQISKFLLCGVSVLDINNMRCDIGKELARVAYRTESENVRR